jgi:cytochrome c553
MKTNILIMALLISLPLSFAQADTKTVNKLLQAYATQGALTADAEQGKQLWQKTFKGNDEFAERSCTSCHTQDLTAMGKHVKTNKEIKPMAPSINPERLSKIKKIKKWFKRNCKWTLGRECTAQEKANLLLYINDQTNL